MESSLSYGGRGTDRQGVIQMPAMKKGMTEKTMMVPGRRSLSNNGSNWLPAGVRRGDEYESSITCASKQKLEFVADKRRNGLTMPLG